MDNSKEKTYSTLFNNPHKLNILEKQQSRNIETSTQSTIVAIDVTTTTSLPKVEGCQDKNNKSVFKVSKKKKICLIMILLLMIKIILISIGFIVLIEFQIKKSLIDQTENNFETANTREEELGWRNSTPCKPVMGRFLKFIECTRNKTKRTKLNNTSSSNITAIETSINPEWLKVVIKDIASDCKKTENFITEKSDLLKNLHTLIKKDTNKKDELCHIMRIGFDRCPTFSERLMDLQCSCLEKEIEIFRVMPAIIGNSRPKRFL